MVKAFDDGSKQRPFGHCMVAGIDRAPLKVTRPGSRGDRERGRDAALKEMRQANVQEEDHQAHQGEVGALRFCLSNHGGCPFSSCWSPVLLLF